jgi:sirohydrochlorin cobaltochelatase
MPPRRISCRTRIKSQFFLKEEYVKHIFAVFLAFLAFTGAVQASGGEKVMEEKSAIVIASFGTTYETTLEPILALVRETQLKYPGTPVRLAFTSNVIRRIWNERAADTAYRRAHPQIPEMLYGIKNVLGVMADLQNLGYRNIVVQPTLITDGEEFADMTAYVDALASIKTLKPRLQPFVAVGIGKPLTGAYSHAEHLEVLAKVLESDIKQAKAAKAALVYMGHGNEHMSQGAYYELELILNRMYGVPVAIGLVEGLPDYDSVLEKLTAKKVKNVILRPLMYVAGDHAENDMAGDEEDSWKVMLTKSGFNVTPVLEGLGHKAAVRQIFINHLEAAAKEAGIELK